MPQTASEIVVGGNGFLWVAPVGTAAPTTTTTALNAAFIDMGFATEDGVTVTVGKTIVDIRVWQSFYAARKLVTDRNFRVAFALRQWNEVNVPLAFGGTFSGTTPNYKIEPTAPEVVDTRSFVFEWVDGTKNYRLYIPVGIIAEDVESKIARDDSAQLPLSVDALDPGGGVKPWTMYTNDPAYA